MMLYNMVGRLEQLKRGIKPVSIQEEDENLEWL
jgi:hypothetical protein